MADLDLGLDLGICTSSTTNLAGGDLPIESRSLAVGKNGDRIKPITTLIC